MCGTKKGFLFDFGDGYVKAVVASSTTRNKANNGGCHEQIRCDFPSMAARLVKPKSLIGIMKIGCDEGGEIKVGGRAHASSPYVSSWWVCCATYKTTHRSWA